MAKASIKAKSYGVVLTTIEDGQYYQGVQPGGFQSATTQIMVPGPKVILDDLNKRTIVRIAEMPPPIQMPTHKEVLEYKDKDRKVREKTVVPFTRHDDFPFHEDLQMALSTGIIRHVPDDEVKEFYPDVWAQRQEKLVFTNDPFSDTKPMSDLIGEYQQTAGFREEQKKRAANEREERALIESGGIRPATGRASTRASTPNPPPGGPPPPPPPDA